VPVKNTLPIVRANSLNRDYAPICRESIPRLALQNLLESNADGKLRLPAMVGGTTPASAAAAPALPFTGLNGPNGLAVKLMA
jgi:hypothetical protein